MNFKTNNVLTNILSPLSTFINSLEEKLDHSTEDCLKEFHKNYLLLWKNVHMSYEIHKNKDLKMFATSIVNIIKEMELCENSPKLRKMQKYFSILKEKELTKIFFVFQMIILLKNLQLSPEDKCKTIKILIEENKFDVKHIFTVGNILLCVHQIEISLNHLLLIFSEEIMNDIIIEQSRKYSIHRLKQCIGEISSSEKSNETIESKSGSFIIFMDNALDLLSEIDVNKPFTNWGDVYVLIKNNIEELLSHAMSIAQVALPYDTLLIKSSSQKCLSECDELNKQLKIDEKDISLTKLVISKLMETLYCLEERVNTAVLKLLLEVFRDCETPLMQLQEFCQNSRNKNRSLSDLDALIIAFDLHVDRIMQIGLFAIACSTNKQRVLYMQSAMASLESLEGELVPAFSALYLEPNVEVEKHALLLAQHWFMEASNLQDFIHQIVDSAAFARIVLESSKTTIEEIYKNHHDKGVLVTSVNVESTCQEVALLIRHLDICISKVFINPPLELKKQKEMLYNVLNECHSAVNYFLNDKICNKEGSHRVIKRFQVLVTLVKRIHFTLVEIDKCDEQNKTENKRQMNEINEVIFDNALKLAEEDNINVEEGQPLALLMLRGELIRKERSILYQTPKKLTKPRCTLLKTPIEYKSIISITSKESLRTKFANKIDQELWYDKCLENTTLNLNVTEILENLSNKDDSLNISQEI